jgi:hypothetical protein
VVTTRQWLEGLGLVRYAEVFEDNDLDLDLVTDLDDRDLEKLGVFKMGHRKRILPSRSRTFEQTSPR